MGLVVTGSVQANVQRQTYVNTMMNLRDT